MWRLKSSRKPVTDDHANRPLHRRRRRVSGWPGGHADDVRAHATDRAHRVHRCPAHGQGWPRHPGGSADRTRIGAARGDSREWGIDRDGHDLPHSVRQGWPRAGQAVASRATGPGPYLDTIGQCTVPVDRRVTAKERPGYRAFRQWQRWRARLPRNQGVGRHDDRTRPSGGQVRQYAKRRHRGQPDRSHPAGFGDWSQADRVVSRYAPNAQAPPPGAGTGLRIRRPC